VLFRNILFFMGESWKNLFRNGWMSLASIGVVAVTLFILSVFVLINMNVHHLTEVIEQDVEIALYIDEEATSDEREQLVENLRNHPEIKKADFVSKEEGLERLRDQLGEENGLLEGYENPEDNPLRDAYEISMHDPEAVSSVAREIETYPAVGGVEFGEDVVENLFDFTGVLQVTVLGLMVALALTATFLISHTIRLTVMLRKREIMIMKYVGATNWFIRWPFLFEGFNLGLLGTVIPLVGIYFGYESVLQWIDANLKFFPSLIPLETAMGQVIILVVPLGMALGIIGSLISMGRYLKV